MQVPLATNFNDYVALMAANSAHALVMDLWWRLDFTLRDYRDALKRAAAPWNRDAIEEAVSLDPALGVGFALSIRELRLLRNQVAHGSTHHLSSEDAAAYARQAFRLIAAVARRVSHLEGAA